MSYCRWSTDDFQCDLYCYEDVSGGWTTHVAGNRIEWTPPDGGTFLDLPKPLAPPAEFDAWVARHKARSAALESGKRSPIGLPYDGQTFSDPSLQAFKDRLLMLRAAGYRFPDYVIESVDEEIAEAT